jgi:hypothetical protein
VISNNALFDGFRKTLFYFGFHSTTKGTGENLNMNENLESRDLSELFKCRSCGKEFDSFGDMQKHITVEHMQKADIP